MYELLLIFIMFTTILPSAILPIILFMTNNSYAVKNSSLIDRVESACCKCGQCFKNLGLRTAIRLDRQGHRCYSTSFLGNGSLLFMAE